MPQWAIGAASGDPDTPERPHLRLPADIDSLPRVPRTERRLAALLALACALGFLLFSEGAISGSDGEAMYETTRAVVADHDLSIPTELGIRGRDGKTFTRLGLGLPLVAIPAYVAGAAAGSLFGHRSEIEHALVSSMIPLICAALVWAMYRLGRRLGGSPRASAFVAVASVVGTFALAYTKEFFSEPLAVLGLVLCCEALLARRWRSAALALMLAVLTRPQLVLLVPLFMVAVWADEDRYLALRAAVPPMIGGGVLVAAYNAARFGSIFSFGYQDYGFNVPSGTAIWNFLVGPTKSIVLFAPIVLVLPAAVWALRAHRRLAATALTLNCVVVVLVTVSVAFWGGGWSWGPRYLLLALIPACAALAPWITTTTRYKATVVLFAVGALVSLPTLIVSTRAQQLSRPDADSPTPWAQVRLMAPTLRHTAGHLYEFSPQSGEYYRSATVWQVGATRVLKRKGLPLAAAGSIAIIGLAAATGWQFRDELRRVEGAAEPLLSDRRP